MKKSFSIIILLFYMVPAIGINVSVHYCGKKISSISIGMESAKECACGSKKEKKSCCRDKAFNIKLEDSQHKASQADMYSNSLGTCFIPSTSVSIYNYQAFTSSVDAPSHHPPNEIRPIALYIINGVFRI